MKRILFRVICVPILLLIIYINPTLGLNWLDRLGCWICEIDDKMEWEEIVRK